MDAINTTAKSKMKNSGNIENRYEGRKDAFFYLNGSSSRAVAHDSCRVAPASHGVAPASRGVAPVFRGAGPPSHGNENSIIK